MEKINNSTQKCEPNTLIGKYSKTEGNSYLNEKNASILRLCKFKKARKYGSPYYLAGHCLCVGRHTHISGLKDLGGRKYLLEHNRYHYILNAPLDSLSEAKGFEIVGYANA